MKILFANSGNFYCYHFKNYLASQGHAVLEARDIYAAQTILETDGAELDLMIIAEPNAAGLSDAEQEDLQKRFSATFWTWHAGVIFLERNWEKITRLPFFQKDKERLIYINFDVPFGDQELKRMREKGLSFFNSSSRCVDIISQLIRRFFQE